jgi:hypothetical protein
LLLSLRSTAMAFQSFSDDLKARMIRYAQKKYDKDITPEEAEEYLRSLANVYLAFYEIEKYKRRVKKSLKL